MRISDWSSDVCSSDLPDDPTLLVIRRVVYAEGRTRAFVNGSPVNAGQLRELGEMLIEVFGQSESQTLLRVDVQRDALDDYGCSEATREAVIAAEIGRAACRERVFSTCSSRWSPYH